MVIIIFMMSLQLFAFDILAAKFTKSLNQLNIIDENRIKASAKV